jgi:hypothetical protein
VPEKQLPDVASFEAFGRALIKRGFRKMRRTEFPQDYWRLALKAPSDREGKETGFVFSANGLDVVVWTSFLEREGHARDEDAGWVLIKDGDTVQYFSHPHPRTKNFLHTMLVHAALARLRALHRPLCPVCSARMNITNGKGLKARFWQCKRPEYHRKPQNLSWDHGLPPEALEYVKPVREARRKYRAKLRKQGKEPGKALQLRIGWKAQKPQNAVPARR